MTCKRCGRPVSREQAQEVSETSGIVCPSCADIMCPSKVTKLTYSVIGISKGLFGDRLKLYVDYMKARWADREDINCTCGYADEWADRFLSGYEYEASDSVGRVVLEGLKEKYQNGGLK